VGLARGIFAGEICVEEQRGLKRAISLH
jgi:hypothetical protein